MGGEYLVERDAMVAGYRSANRLSARSRVADVLRMISRAAGLTGPRATVKVTVFFAPPSRFLKAAAARFAFLAPAFFLAAPFAFFRAAPFPFRAALRFICPMGTLSSTVEPDGPAPETS